MKRKTNPELAKAIFIAKKNNLTELADALSRPSRKQAKINMIDLNNSKGDTVIVSGKVLSLGEPTKKLKVYAISFSEKALEKLKANGSEAKTIFEGLNKDPKLNGEIIK